MRTICMNVSAIKIDTLAMTKELEAAGIPTQQAEAQTRVYAKVINTLVVDQLATKQDLVVLKEDIIALKQDIVAVDQKFTRLFSKLESDMQNLAMKITLGLGGMITAAVLILATVIKL